jgi:hypothetical protein
MVKTRRQDDGVTVDSNAETDTEIQTDYSDFEMPVNATVIQVPPGNMVIYMVNLLPPPVFSTPGTLH